MIEGVKRDEVADGGADVLIGFRADKRRGVLWLPGLGTDKLPGLGFKAPIAYSRTREILPHMKEGALAAGRAMARDGGRNTSTAISALRQVPSLNCGPTTKSKAASFPK